MQYNIKNKKRFFMIGSKIKTLRRGLSLTQLDLAKMMDVSAGCIALWENGKRNPDTEALKKMSRIFNVSTDYLLENYEGECLELKLPTKENTITILGRNGALKTYVLDDSKIKAIQIFAETLTSDEYK